MNFRAAPHEDGADRGKLGNGAARRHHAREPGVLSIKPFRRLWIALSLSSLGDWLSIVALTALAPSLATGGLAAKGSAVSGVWLATLLPALLFGPLAGALADRLDRRMTMIVGDVIRGLLFLSIPLFPNLTWIYVAKFLAGVASQFWNPATAASIPNLVPKDKLERANQLSLLTTYGTAPLAAGLFSVLALVSEGISRVTPLFHASNVDLALYFNAASYFISALTVYFIREIPKRNGSGKISVPSTFRSIWEGWRFIGKTPVVRGLVIGMVGAFAAAGVVVGLGYPYITYTLHGGSAGWGLVFAAIFVGMALGMGARHQGARQLQPPPPVRPHDRGRGGAARAHRPGAGAGRGRPVRGAARRAVRDRVRDRLHHRRARGGRRHPRPGLRLLPVLHPGHPVHRHRRRAVPLGPA